MPFLSKKVEKVQLEVLDVLTKFYAFCPPKVYPPRLELQQNWLTSKACLLSLALLPSK